MAKKDGKIGEPMVLPEICAVTGGVIGLQKREEKVLFLPYWSLGLLLLGIFPFVIAFAVMRKEQVVIYYLSGEGRKHILIRRLCTVGCFLAAVGSILLVFDGISWGLLFAFFFLGLAGYLYRRVCFPFQYSRTRSGVFVLSGLPEEFSNA